MLRRDLIEQRLREVHRGNKERASILQRMFDEAGCNGANFNQQRVKGFREPNLICALPGTSDSLIVVGAHFDHVDRGIGAIDNWSGAALLPSLYQGLTLSSRRHTFVFIGFTGEERGLYGSRYYVQTLGAEHKARIKAMVNLDTLGLSSTKISLDRSEKKLVQTLWNVASAKQLPIANVNTHLVGTSDSQSFLLSKIPTIDIHSVTQETLPILHSIRDNLDAVQWDTYYDTYKLLAAYLASLDAILE